MIQGEIEEKHLFPTKLRFCSNIIFIIIFRETKRRKHLYNLNNDISKNRRTRSETAKLQDDIVLSHKNSIQLEHGENNKNTHPGTSRSTRTTGPGTRSKTLSDKVYCDNYLSSSRNTSDRAGSVVMEQVADEKITLRNKSTHFAGAEKQWVSRAKTMFLHS